MCYLFWFHLYISFILKIACIKSETKHLQLKLQSMLIHFFIGAEMKGWERRMRSGEGWVPYWYFSGLIPLPFRGSNSRMERVGYYCIV